MIFSGKILLIEGSVGHVEKAEVALRIHLVGFTNGEMLGLFLNLRS